MGVHGTYCQLCGLPTQHDHYVPTATSKLKIYRGASQNGGRGWEPGERPFPFGPEHAWLKDAVVLPWDEERVLRGPVEDGAIRDEDGRPVMVFEGGDEGLAFHEACWELQGRPGSTGPAFRANESYAWAAVESYQEQLFDFHGLEHDGKAWMLADPRLDARSRSRIAAMLEVARNEVKEAGTSIPDILEKDRDWVASVRRGRDGGRSALVRARMYTIENVPKDGYGELVRLTRPYAGGAFPGPGVLSELEEVESALKEAVERDAAAILALTAIAGGRAIHLVYARDGARTAGIAKGLAGGAEVAVSGDSGWAEAPALLRKCLS